MGSRLIEEAIGVGKVGEDGVTHGWTETAKGPQRPHLETAY